MKTELKKSKFRKFIVKNFALSFRTKIFGEEYVGLRCTRIMAPYFLLMALIIAFDPSYPDVQWYDIALYTIWAFFFLLTFTFFWFVYFAKYPVKREELDDEQKSFYDIFQEKNTTI